MKSVPRLLVALAVVAAPAAFLVASSAAPVLAQTPPSGPADPAPMKERVQWVFELRYAHGDVFLVSTQRVELPKPTLTGRAVGRFALELFEGPALLERVRFDFPLLSPPPLEDAGGMFPKPDFRGGTGVSRVGVLFPATSKGVRLELLDRATGQRWTLPWPPEATTDAG